MNFHKKYTKNVLEPWFTYIKEGLKTVEGRLDKGDFSKMKKGDIITFVNNNQKVDVIIIDIDKYDTFSEMLRNKTLKRTLPDPSIKRNENGVKVYRQFYSPEDEKKYGVLAISFRKINN